MVPIIPPFESNNQAWENLILSSKSLWDILDTDVLL